VCKAKKIYSVGEVTDMDSDHGSGSPEPNVDGMYVKVHKQFMICVDGML